LEEQKKQIQGEIDSNDQKEEEFYERGIESIIH
jgi:hypothetical protein